MATRIPFNAPADVGGLIERIQQDLEAGRLRLPTLPQIAARVQSLLQRPELSMDELTGVLRADASITARLLQLVNSAAYRPRYAISDLKLAVTRLGIDQIQHLVAAFAAEQMFQANHQTLNQMLREAWSHSLKVASLCHVIAGNSSELKGDLAFIAGLIHDVGVLPIIKYAESASPSIDRGTVGEAIKRHHAELGGLILESWNFPRELVVAVRGHEDVMRDPAPEPDYADVVLVANILVHLGSDHRHAELNTATVPAFRKLSMSLELDPTAMDLAAEIGAE